MGRITASNGQMVTEEMIDKWSEALDKDEWPKGWKTIGSPVDGPPPGSTSQETLSIKIPSYLKSAITHEAKAEGKSTSEFVRSVLTERLVSIA